MIGEMIMEDLDGRGVLVSIKIINPRGTQPGEHMQIQGQKASSSVSLVRHQRRRHGSDSLQGELRKIKAPSFDGENNKGEDAEAWFLEMRKYLQLDDY
jgi:hypothetical protein